MNSNSKPEASDEELGRFGIVRVPADHFLWGGFRYSHARDAIAAAKRGAAQ
jgi:hypothetical protein